MRSKLIGILALFLLASCSAIYAPEVIPYTEQNTKPVANTPKPSDPPKPTEPSEPVKKDPVLIFEQNFDAGTLAGMSWSARPGKDKGPEVTPILSTEQKVSGTRSLKYPGNGGIAERKFAIDDAHAYENLILEWKARVTASTSLTMSLYPISSDNPLVRLSVTAGELRVFGDNKAVVRITPQAKVPLNVWINFRIVLTGNKYNVYMNDILVGEDLPTPMGLTKATRVYSTSAATAYIDDVKLSYIPN